MKWAIFTDNNWVRCGWEDNRCRVLVLLCHIPFTCLIDLLTNSMQNSDDHTVWVFYEGKHGQVLSRTTSAMHVRPFVWSVCGCLMLESVFVGYFCSTAQLGLVVFGTLMKGDGDKTWLFPIWRHCLCHWAFKVFYQQSAKWLCEICCAGFTELAVEEVYSSQDVWLRGVEFPPFVLCLLCISYLNERSLLMWILLGLQS